MYIKRTEREGLYANAGTTRLVNTNDFTGYSFGGITFASGAGAFVLGGNAFKEQPERTAPLRCIHGDFTKGVLPSLSAR